MPHQQASQNAPGDLQEALLGRAAALRGVTVGPSGISVPGARAFHLDPRQAAGPPEAFMLGTEFAHLHPPYDGSLHLALPVEEAATVIERGWGELHPAARLGYAPATALMVFGPREEAELEVVWRILETSYLFASGALEERR
ncbi:MAG: luciferase family protein [Actinomycetota bacterium]